MATNNKFDTLSRTLKAVAVVDADFNKILTLIAIQRPLVLSLEEENPKYAGNNVWQKKKIFHIRRKAIYCDSKWLFNK